MILIVEDEAISRRALASLLSSCGYATEAVRSAEDALQLVEEGHTPEVALIDLDLPGMNGLDLIRRLEKILPETRPVLITATSRERLDSFCRTHPVSYLRKPLNFGELLTVIGSGMRHN